MLLQNTRFYVVLGMQAETSRCSIDMLLMRHDNISPLSWSQKRIKLLSLPRQPFAGLVEHENCFHEHGQMIFSENLRLFDSVLVDRLDKYFGERNRWSQAFDHNKGGLPHKDWQSSKVVETKVCCCGALACILKCSLFFKTRQNEVELSFESSRNPAAWCHSHFSR